MWDDDQRRVHAAAAERHRRRAVGRRREPPVDHGHAARLLHRGQPVGRVAADRSTRTARRWPRSRTTTTSARATSTASSTPSRAPTSSSSSGVPRRHGPEHRQPVTRRVAATGAEVLLLQTTGAFCTQGMADVEKGTWKPIVIMSGTCGSLSQFFQPLIDQGLTGEGTYLIQNFKDVNDPAYADDPIVKLYQETMQTAGPRPQADHLRHRLDLRLVHDRDPEGGGQLRGWAGPGQHHAGGPRHPRDEPVPDQGAARRRWTA